METVGMIAKIAGYVITFAGLLGTLGKLYSSVKALAGGQRSLLRGQITEIYYRHVNEQEPTIREYERQMLDSAYEAYVALKGNSYIKDIYAKMRMWKVIT